MSQRPPRSPVAGLLVDLALVVGGVLALGLAVGVLWPQVVDPSLSERTAQGISTGEVQLGKVFAADGWFAVLGFAGSFVLGVLLMLRRRGNEVVVLLLLLAGTYAVAHWVAGPLGTATGPPDPVSVLRDAEVGDTAPARVEVHSRAVELVWPLGAAAGSLLVLLAVTRLDHERLEGRPQEAEQIPARAPSGD